MWRELKGPAMIVAMLALAVTAGSLVIELGSGAVRYTSALFLALAVFMPAELEEPGA